jgi:beta-1,2-N-acetylglucosaminyltransferase
MMMFVAHVLILEEDLEVAPDFFHYFAQTRPLLERDTTLYCISAWNDLGYQHTAKDPSLLMRLDTMPGLGWMLKRSLFVDELRAKWPKPDQFWDWDMWMRMNEQRKGRECIVPDISRTFHFGAHGVNMNDYFQDLYFKKHLLSTVPFAKLEVEPMETSRYEQHLHGLLAESVPIDTTRTDVCDFASAIPKGQSQNHVIYMRQTQPHDYDTWSTLATCFKVWDLDARGFHKA